MTFFPASRQALSASFTASFEGQNLAPLHAAIAGHTGGRDPDLNLYSLNHGFFIVGPGRDGMVFDAAGTAMRDTCLFGQGPLPALAELRARAVRLDYEPLVVFDCAWRNYYHWLCLAIAKMLIARQIPGFDARPVIPEYREADGQGWSMAFCRPVWEQSLTLTRLDSVAARLPDGIYTADRVHTIWLNTPQPALLPLLPAFDHAFDPVRAKLRASPGLPRRILLARRANARLATAETELIERVASRHGFTTVYLEDLSFTEQAQLFFNAEAVIAAHGAGLSNILFGRSTLRILELNRNLDGETCPRPWFALIAAARGQTYFHLDASRGELGEYLLGRAVERLCSPAVEDGPPRLAA